MKRLINITFLVLTSLFVTVPVFAQIGGTPEATPEIVSEPTCFVITDSARTVRVRVGPGENRTSVTFLPQELEVPVLGQAEDDSGNLWYQLDKEVAAPGRSINEAWIASNDENLESLGECDDILNTNAPPIIPIITQTLPDPVEEHSDDAEPSSADENGHPSDGTWIISWARTSNVSCVGTDNVVVATAEIFGQTGNGFLPRSSMLINISRSSDTITYMFMFTPMYDTGNGIYRGEITFIDNDGSTLPAIVVVNSASRESLSGYMIVNAGDCSATVQFSARL